METKKLYRSQANRTICGVCGGIGEYFHIDPTLIRLAWVLVACMGPGLIAYIIAAVIIPDEPTIVG
ncbi:MAG: PspC domain-containing protein [Hespellia sp.]|nr:PspC domain-containing protein [Hespellia sp.]